MQTRLGLFVEYVLTAALLSVSPAAATWPQAESFANSGRFTCCTKHNRHP